jgi:diguanylate cyclase (GGDEF)-like protein
VSTESSAGDPRTILPAAVAAVVEEGDLDAALGRVLAITAERLGAILSAVLVGDPDRPGLVVVASTGMDEAADARLADAARDAADPFAIAISGRVAEFDRAGVMPDGSGIVGSYLPLVVARGGVEEVLGAVGLVWPAPRILDDAERETLVAIAGLSAIAVDRARLGSTAAERSEWFERMAHTDPLTGLANERTISRILELELARAGRQGGEVSLAMFDVDDFRTTNREGGNEAGDDVLRRVAEVLAESVRLVDTVGRIGGDEFVLIAPGSAGMTVAQRVLDGISALPAIGGRVVSISAGVARFPVDGTDAEELIGAAKDGLERARAAGRGSVSTGATKKEKA